MEETEAKFYLTNPPALEARLKKLGAELAIPRVYENNLRFDRPDGSLTRRFQVLRLRQDAKIRVTYKGPGYLSEGVRVRGEIEFTVDDFESAKALFEALGYQPFFIYEKYRTTYHWQGAELVLDDTPLGNFIEIEAESGSRIAALAAELGLDWAARINESYAMLFQAAVNSLGLKLRDMTFENFKQLDLTPAHMGIRIADKG